MDDPEWEFSLDTKWYETMRHEIVCYTVLWVNTHALLLVYSWAYLCKGTLSRKMNTVKALYIDWIEKRQNY